MWKQCVHCRGGWDCSVRAFDAVAQTNIATLVCLNFRFVRNTKKENYFMFFVDVDWTTTDSLRKKNQLQLYWSINQLIDVGRSWHTRSPLASSRPATQIESLGSRIIYFIFWIALTTCKDCGIRGLMTSSFRRRCRVTPVKLHKSTIKMTKSIDCNFCFRLGYW